MENTHLLFEEWLLSDTALQTDEAEQLRQHLETCASCQRLSQSWKEVEDLFWETPMAAPAPHFTQRWETRLVAETMKRERRQTAVVLYVCALSGLVLLGWLGLWLYPLFKPPYPLLLAWGYQWITAIYYYANLGSVFVSFVRAIAGIVPANLALLFCAALGCLGVFWVMTYKKLISTRRVTQ